MTNAAEARIAEAAGACAVMALERVPSDIRAQGGVARMSHPRMIRDIQEAVSIPGQQQQQRQQRWQRTPLADSIRRERSVCSHECSFHLHLCVDLQ